MRANALCALAINIVVSPAFGPCVVTIAAILQVSLWQKRLAQKRHLLEM